MNRKTARRPTTRPDHVFPFGQDRPPFSAGDFYVRRPAPVCCAYRRFCDDEFPTQNRSALQDTVHDGRENDAEGSQEENAGIKPVEADEKFSGKAGGLSSGNPNPLSI